MKINWKKKKNTCLVSVLSICMLGACVTAGTGCSAGPLGGVGQTETAVYEDSSGSATQSAGDQTAASDQAAAGQDQAAAPDQAAAGQDQAAAPDQAAAGQDQTVAADQAAAGQDQAAAGQDQTAAPDQAAAGQDQTAAQDQAAAGQDKTAAPDQAAAGQDQTAAPDQAAAGQDQTAAPDQAAAGQDQTAAAADQTAAGQDQAAAQGQTADGESGLITEEDITYNIVLDPGHGGEDSGANGWNSSEKRLNLIIGKYLKKELEQYEHVKVGMTRDKDVYVKLHDRVKKAREKNADLVISLHNDSWDVNTPYDNGSSVLVAQKGSYRTDMALQEARLGRNILSELEELGLVKRGLLRKKSDRVPAYEDGSQGDYHAIIRDGMKYGIPSILIEHAFCDSERDYKKFLSSNEKLQKLAAADARGVARYLGLRRKGTGEVLPPVTVEDNKQRCKADKSSDVSLFRKRYYNAAYERQEVRLKEEVDAENAALQEKKVEEEEVQVQEKKEEEDPAAVEAKIKAESIARRNAAAQKKVPKVILISLFVSAALVLIKEFDIGFRFEFRFRKRNDRHDPWKNLSLKYNS